MPFHIKVYITADRQLLPLLPLRRQEREKAELYCLYIFNCNSVLHAVPAPTGSAVPMAESLRTPPYCILHSAFCILHSTFYILHSTFYLIPDSLLLPNSRCIMDPLLLVQAALVWLILLA